MLLLEGVRPLDPEESEGHQDFLGSQGPAGPSPVVHMVLLPPVLLRSLFWLLTQKQGPGIPSGSWEVTGLT